MLVLILTGAGLVALAPVEPPARPQEPVPVTECELVQLAVYELDAEPPEEFEQERYDDLTDVQQRVFDEARAAEGGFRPIRRGVPDGRRGRASVLRRVRGPSSRPGASGWESTGTDAPVPPPSRD
jgi:hypothetical protein